ncbi:T9SS type A sorting domain-containing protein [Fulvivirga sp. M361]|uniref:T9SS type A sorting domain-containing protein n=1 Tax=Fulvivirga sp. M361 TaxID=2594266 RepID=UPI001625A0A1|nr:T9SS type A sorting domain-containing protein [Fulvivirga sp. M361]
MKYIKIINYRIIILFILFQSQIENSIGQSKEECGTVPNQQYLDYLENSLTEREKLVNRHYKDRLQGRATSTSIPVQFHVSRTTEGNDAAVSDEDLLKVIDNINTSFSIMGISFTSCGQTKFIDDTFLHTNFEKDLHDPLLDQYDDKFILNIYFFADITDVNGYAKFPQDQVDRIVITSERALTSTVEHELGHYFSLLHTYETSRGNELVSGNNCRVAGDFICDTPPDPGDRSDFNACIYNGTAVDGAGDRYAPDGFNYMGRGQATCRNRFSILQRERILASLLMDRYYLVDCSQTAPENSCISTITSFPYEESFEDFAGGTEWRQNVDDDFGWRIRHRTSSSNTGPDEALDGDYFMYTEASDYMNATGILSSPCFDLQDRSTLNVTFGYHLFGTDIGKLSLQLTKDEGATWASVWVQQGNKGNQWNNAVITLDEYVGNTIQLRFVGETGSGSRGDMAIDNIVISSAPLVTGVRPGPDKNTLTLYPNPARDILTIQYSDLKQGHPTLYVTNVSGHVVYEQKLSNISASKEIKLDLKEWNPGVYYVRIIGQEKEFTTMFVHQP